MCHELETFLIYVLKKLLKRGRRRAFINNVLNENTDLYTALYKDLDSPIYIFAWNFMRLNG